MEEWDFENSEWWWDVALQAVKFDAMYDGDTYIFAISRNSLVDYFQTQDTKEDAIANFEEHIGRIHDLAIRFSSDYNSNEDSPHYLIKNQDCVDYNL
ncbi:MAG: DUF1488 family protein [Cycloclasticus sp.]